MAGSEFQTDGAMKLKERSPKDFRFCLGFLSNFSFEDWRDRDGSQVQKDEERYGGKDPSKWRNVLLHFIPSKLCMSFQTEIKLIKLQAEV